jgi:hypothetical protein
VQAVEGLAALHLLPHSFHRQSPAFITLAITTHALPVASCLFVLLAESTLRLACKVFDVETATVSLLTGERIYLVGACGALPVCVCPDRWGFCGWSFLNPNHELNVVENMLEDAR